MLYTEYQFVGFVPHNNTVFQIFNPRRSSPELNVDKSFLNECLIDMSKISPKLSSNLAYPFLLLQLFIL